MGNSWDYTAFTSEAPGFEPDDRSDIVRWFSTSGDMDDFIYFGEDPESCSER